MANNIDLNDGSGTHASIQNILLMDYVNLD
jgi:hypothetical protein